MKKILLSVALSLAFANIAQAGFFSDSPEDKVKETVFNRQTGLTIGDAIDEYPFCKSVNWSVEQQDDIQAVRMRCELKMDNFKDYALNFLKTDKALYDAEFKKQISYIDRDIENIEEIVSNKWSFIYDDLLKKGPAAALWWANSRFDYKSGNFNNYLTNLERLKNNEASAKEYFVKVGKEINEQYRYKAITELKEYKFIIANLNAEFLFKDWTNLKTTTLEIFFHPGNPKIGQAVSFIDGYTIFEWNDGTQAVSRYVGVPSMLNNMAAEKHIWLKPKRLCSLNNNTGCDYIFKIAQTYFNANNLDIYIRYDEQ